MSPLSPSLFLKPLVPGLGDWLAAGQGLLSPGGAREVMGTVVMHGQPLKSVPLGKAGYFPKGWTGL